MAAASQRTLPCCYEVSIQSRSSSWKAGSFYQRLMEQNPKPCLQKCASAVGAAPEPVVQLAGLLQQLLLADRAGPNRQIAVAVEWAPGMRARPGRVRRGRRRCGGRRGRVRLALLLCALLLRLSWEAFRILTTARRPDMFKKCLTIPGCKGHPQQCSRTSGQPIWTL